MLSRYVGQKLLPTLGEQLKQTPDACPVCSGRQSRLLGEKAGHEVFDCRDCGVVFTPAGSIGAEIIDLYSRYYERATFDIEHHVARSLEKLVQSSERFRKTGRLLDV